MTRTNHPLIDHADFDRYEAQLADYTAGRMAHSAFVAQRLLLGIYGQRQEGLCMVRTRVPGGRLQVSLLPAVADALERYSDSSAVHLTTRQNVQFHHVKLERTPRLLRELADAGITTREAAGNTVRNVTACTLAGLCPAERVDVNVHVEAITHYFARHPLTQSLPRKFKIAVSGCSGDCAQSAANDLSVIAEERDGHHGFRLLVGGGLGARPHLPVVLDEFVSEADLLPSIEAALVLHDRHSDRQRRARSRIKFLVEEFGPRELRERYASEALHTRAAFDAVRAPRALWREPTAAPFHTPDGPRAPLAQWQGGAVAVPVQVPRGELTATQLRLLHTLLRDTNIGEVRITAAQGLVVPHVAAARVPWLIQGLERIGLGVPRRGDNVVACPGTATCQLGITASPRVAQLLSGGDSDLRVRVNGCQNSCVHSDLADIGLYGKAKRHFGRMIPGYVLQLGGGGQVLGDDGPEIPAARVPAAVERIHAAFARSAMNCFRSWVVSREQDYFDRLLRDLIEVSEADLDAVGVDQGETALFRVTTSGTGECAGVQAEPGEKLRLDLEYERRLRDAFVAKRMHEQAAEHLHAMLGLGAVLLLRAFRNNGPDALAQLRRHENDDPIFARGAALEARLAAWRSAPDELSFPALAAESDQWIEDLRRHRPAARVTSAAALRAAVANL